MWHKGRIFATSECFHETVEKWNQIFVCFVQHLLRQRHLTEETLKFSESLSEGEQSQNSFPNNTDSADICTELQKQ